MWEETIYLEKTCEESADILMIVPGEVGLIDGVSIRLPVEPVFPGFGVLTETVQGPAGAADGVGPAHHEKAKGAEKLVVIQPILGEGGHPARLIHGCKAGAVAGVEGAKIPGQLGIMGQHPLVVQNLTVHPSDEEPGLPGIIQGKLPEIQPRVVADHRQACGPVVGQGFDFGVFLRGEAVLTDGSLDPQIMEGDDLGPGQIREIIFQPDDLAGVGGSNENPPGHQKRP